MTGLILAVYSLDWVPAWVWWALAWVLTSIPASLLIGRALRNRDAQIPQEVEGER